jgi:hypothetical protein
MSLDTENNQHYRLSLFQSDVKSKALQQQQQVALQKLRRTRATEIVSRYVVRRLSQAISPLPIRRRAANVDIFDGRRKMREIFPRCSS